MVCGVRLKPPPPSSAVWPQERGGIDFAALRLRVGLGGFSPRFIQLHGNNTGGIKRSHFCQAFLDHTFTLHCKCTVSTTLCVPERRPHVPIVGALSHLVRKEKSGSIWETGAHVHLRDALGRLCARILLFFLLDAGREEETCVLSDSQPQRMLISRLNGCDGELLIMDNRRG